MEMSKENTFVDTDGDYQIVQEYEYKVSSVSIDENENLCLIINHTYDGEEDNFAVYASPDLTEEEIEAYVESKLIERLELLDSIKEKENHRKELENSFKDKLEKLRGKKFKLLRNKQK